MGKADLGQEIVVGLRNRLLKRVREHGASPTPDLVDTLAADEAAALQQQEERYRAAGQAAVAEAFQMVRVKLLTDIAREISSGATGRS